MAKDPAAVSLGRKGGKARVKAQTPEQRKQSARHAALARWMKIPAPAAKLQTIDEFDQYLAATEPKKKAGKK